MNRQSVDLTTAPPMIDWGKAAQTGVQTALMIDESRIRQGNAIIERRSKLERLPYEIQQLQTETERANVELMTEIATAPEKIKQQQAYTKKLEMETSEEAVLNHNQKTQEELDKRRFERLYGARIAQASADLAQNPDKESAVAKHASLMDEIDQFGFITESGDLFRQAYINAETEVEAVVGKSYWDAVPKKLNEKGEIVPDDSPASRSATAESILENPNSTPAQRQHAERQRNQANADEKKELSYAVKKKIYDLKQEGISKGVAEDQLDQYVAKRRRIEELGGPNGEAQGLSEMASVSRDFAMATANDFIKEFGLSGKFKELDGKDAFDKYIGTIQTQIAKVKEGMTEEEQGIFDEQLGIQFLDAQIESISSSVERAESEFNQEVLKAGSDPQAAFNIGVNNFGGESISNLTTKARRGAWMGVSDFSWGLIHRIGSLGFAHYESISVGKDAYGNDTAFGKTGWAKSGSTAYTLTRNELDSAIGYLENLKRNPAINPVYHNEIDNKILALQYAQKKLEFGPSNTPKAYEEFVGNIRTGAEGLFEATTDVTDPSAIRANVLGIKQNINKQMEFTFQLPAELRYDSPYRTATGQSIQDMKSQQQLQIKMLKEERNQRASALGAKIKYATDSGAIGTRNRGSSSLNPVEASN